MGKFMSFFGCLCVNFESRFIPEFISRLPSITALSPLTVSDLKRILTEVKGSLMSQYQSLFGYSGVEIRFTSGALDEICQKAFERGGGARGLRGIMVSSVWGGSISLTTFLGIPFTRTHVRSAVSFPNSFSKYPLTCILYSGSVSVSSSSSFC